MSRLVEAKRTIGLLVVLMAAVVLLSGPLTEVLDPGSEPVAEAKKKHKKKKKKKKKPQFNVVQCPTEGEDSDRCFGTAANDFLVGGSEDRQFGAFDHIFGGEGNDVFNGGNGSDLSFDGSTASSDVYLFPATDFGNGIFSAVISDEGGDGDIAGLSSYSIGEFEVSTINNDTLKLDGPSDRDIVIRDFFAEGKIEAFLFREGSFTGDQIASSATNATAQEGTASEERPSEEELPSREATNQEEASS